MLKGSFGRAQPGEDVDQSEFPSAHGLTMGVNVQAASAVLQQKCSPLLSGSLALRLSP